MGIERILVRVPNWIGDAVMTLPALESLGRRFTGAKITILAKPRVRAVYEQNPFVYEIVDYDSTGAHSGLKGRMSLARSLKKKKFTKAVLFQNAFEAALITFLARIPERIGYARDMRGPFLTKSIPVTDEIKKRHQVFYYLNIVKELGGELPKEPVPQIYITEKESELARATLEEAGVGPLTAMLGVAPGATYGPAKRWPADSFAETIKELSSDFSMAPVIFGGPDDVDDSEALSKRLAQKDIEHLNLTGKTGLREFIAMAAGAKLFISNDSGPMHIAAALGVPTVAIFASTEPELTGPLGKAVNVLCADVECRPCFDRKCKDKDYECMDMIKPYMALEVARTLLSRTAATPAGAGNTL